MTLINSALLGGLVLMAGAVPAPAEEVATFGGGCFWCVEEAFDRVEGVVATTSGYMGGRLANPTYEAVSAGGTGHAEVVQVRFDPRRVSYPQLLAVYWRNVDPTTPNRQFCDHGDQYRSVIFYHDQTQREQAEASRAALQRDKPFPEALVTEITAAGPFYAAESYHQDYHLRNPVRYKYYKFSCGRAQRLEQLWGATPANQQR